MNWLVVGTGDIAQKRVMPAIAAEPRSRIVAVCDLVPERAEEAASAHGARAYTDYSEALTNPAVEAVYVATPVFLHVPQAIEALTAGKHVVVEKPVGLSYADACRLSVAAEQAAGRCAVAYFRRFTPRYRMAHEMLQRGDLGQVVLVRMTYFSWFDPTPGDPKHWRVVPDLSGGGPLADMGTHMLDVMVGLLGVPERVVAKVATLTHSYQVEDSCVALMQLAGGAQVIASFHWNSRTWSHEFEIVGTEAKIRWHPYDGLTVVKTVGRDTEEIELPNHPNVHYPLIEDFVSAVAEGRQPQVSVTEAAKTSLLLDAIYMSASQSREVTVTELQA